ncbi:BON domain-containing protein [Paraburkholderia sp. BCC1884]|uniref:BON domain-containing protein n=1 Tax=Paraburkholderia sp. BCC1884 TaxID=2562668 RepID=UPI00118309E6|nr:BON domain-containing protein [Paraburkholderia sp. BCC1884]
MKTAPRKTASPRLSDAHIAAEATRRLAWDDAVPAHTLTVEVAHGRITLLGELAEDRQRTAALEDITRLFGVTGVRDHTTIKRVAQQRSNKRP